MATKIGKYPFLNSKRKKTLQSYFEIITNNKNKTMNLNYIEILNLHEISKRKIHVFYTFLRERKRNSTFYKRYRILKLSPMLGRHCTDSGCNNANH